jgi:hypothetical protein
MADILTFRKRRTYADECRKQGVGQAIADPVLQPGSALERWHALECPGTVAASREREIARVQVICEAYKAAGLGDAHFDLLAHLLTTDYKPSGAAVRLFEAAAACVKKPDDTREDMTNESLFAAIHRAVHPAGQAVIEAGTTPAEIGEKLGKGEPVYREDIDEASAHASDFKEGFKSENDRLAAALGATGIKGDSGRMAAAMTLLKQAPNMTAASVVSFVLTNTAASGFSDYQARRIAAASYAAPAQQAQSSWAAAVSNTNRRIRPKD